MFKVFNKSSEKMWEIKRESIDLIITSPPFNIGTEYLEFKDRKTHKEYVFTLKNIYSECFRVLKSSGRFIIEVSDTTFADGVYISLAALTQSICEKAGFSLVGRHINFIKTENGKEILDHGWDKDYTTKNNAHSNCVHFLVFLKSKELFNSQGNIFYSTYLPSAMHPCPFPQKHIKLFLDLYFKKGMSVLDPFIGSGSLGKEVLKQGGNFFGYEVVKEFYENALKNMSQK